MRVNEWLSAYLERHRAKFGPHDWPDRGTSDMGEYSKLWLAAFALARVTEPEADEASNRLGKAPPRYQREHLPAVLAAVEAIRIARGSTANSREAALAASRDCPYCAGEGLRIVYARHPMPGQAECVAAVCVCPYGRWIVRCYSTGATANGHSPALPMPDFGDVLAGRSGTWQAEPADLAAEARR